MKRASTSDAAKRQLNDLFGDEPRSRIINAPKPERVTGEFKCVRMTSGSKDRSTDPRIRLSETGSKPLPATLAGIKARNSSKADADDPTLIEPIQLAPA